ncbi:MAG: hypothetical protein KDA93_21105 [Planctomycetaceae bacterium]|nr:hypothetical protein [Planctomycetaceae bacterium]
MRDIAVWIDQNLVARLENGDTSTVQFDAGLHSVQLGMYGMLGGPPSTDFSEEFQISEGAHLILNFTPAGGFLGTTWISEWSEKID